MKYPKMRWFYKTHLVADFTHLRDEYPTLQYEVSDDDGNLTWTDVPEVYEDE